jgi:TRAP-type C4-dicarboxylate transport system permease small subunit
MDAYIRAVTFLSRAAGVFAALLIGFAVLVICDMVVERYMLNLTTIWQIDVVTYSIVGATFVGSAYVLMTRGHVNVDVLPHYLGARPRFWLALVSAVFSFAFCLTIAVLTFLFWKEAWDNRWVSDTMWRARLWIPYSSMPIGLGILALQYVADIWNLATGRDAPFGITAERKA